MSWHCNCNDERNEGIPWVHVHIAFIDGGIPISIVCHAECLRKALCIKDGYLIEGMDDINDTFLERIYDAEKSIKADDEMVE